MIKFDETYLLYNTVLVFVAVFSFLAEKANKKTARLGFRFIVFLVLFFPAALRYKTGTDYDNYINMFYNTASLYNHEFLWRLLNEFVRVANLRVQWIFVFSAILIYWPICFGLSRNNYSISLVLYVVLTFYFKSFNILRQMIAVSFILCSIVSYERKKWLKAFIYFIVAYNFHSSTLLFIPVFIICSLNIKSKYLPCVLLMIGIVFIIKFNVLQIALLLLLKFGLKYARYINKTQYLVKTSIGTGLGVFSKLLFSILPVFLYSKIKQNNPEKKIALNLSIIYIFSYLLAAQFIILGRIRDLLIMSPLLISGNGVKATGKYRKLCLMCLLAINIFLFEKDIGRQTRDVFSNSIYPYYSIFYEGIIK